MKGNAGVCESFANCRKLRNNLSAVMCFYRGPRWDSDHQRAYWPPGSIGYVNFQRAIAEDATSQEMQAFAQQHPMYTHNAEMAEEEPPPQPQPQDYSTHAHTDMGNPTGRGPPGRFALGPAPKGVWALNARQSWFDRRAPFVCRVTIQRADIV
ncbi:hypothetical protein PLESTM_000924600 [Pleodorina starrii]|nr:hypothetical protein PLESTM_000924600 [Pleodorina starrii]